MLRLIIYLAAALTCAAGPTRSFAHKVDFDPASGNCRVDGKPFFPIGVWVYGLSAEVMADLHEHRFNTVVGNSLSPKDLPMLQRHGMMCVPMGTDEWLKAAANSHSLLGWYLVDEPEGAGVAPEEVKRRYDALKAKDKDHPIGVTHSTREGPTRYKAACDFNMMDIYPVNSARTDPLNASGMWTDAPRNAHGGTPWPTFTYIQAFGGPDTDGGIWAQPLPHEVRFMAFNALVHRANGILYFSYWPRAPITWASITQLNKDIERLVPWLLANGEERKATSSDPAVEIRAKRVEGDAGSWMIIATNGSPKEVRTTLKVDGLADAKLGMPFEAGRSFDAKSGHWSERFSAYDVKVYLVGPDLR